MKKRKVLYAILALGLVLALTTCGTKTMNTERIAASPNFHDGKAENYLETPMLEGDQGSLSIMWELFVKGERPETPIPSVKTDLLSLDRGEEALVWMGHSSFLLQTSGKRFFVDPVLSEAASPVPFGNSPFDGTKLYESKDIPEIDYLIITHDHYDHLSKKTVKAIRDRVGKVICPLGVGDYLLKWGYSEDQIVEMDWDESYQPDAGFNIHCLTARHFSGRGLWGRNKTLWASFMLETPERKIYISGDTGYGDHFNEIGERFGDVDLAFLENGQYDPRWRYIHMHPEEMIKAANDINAKYLMPVHNSKFKLSVHKWNEPLIKLTALNDNPEMILIIPMIGEKTALWDENYTYKEWWIDETQDAEK